MFIYFFLFLTAFLITLAIFPLIIPRLKQSKIVGKDMHKEGMPEVPEMGVFLFMIHDTEKEAVLLRLKKMIPELGTGL